MPLTFLIVVSDNNEFKTVTMDELHPVLLLNVVNELDKILDEKAGELLTQPPPEPPVNDTEKGEGEWR